MADDLPPRVSRRSVLRTTAMAGLLCGSGAVASSLPAQTESTTPPTGHWLVETGLDEELTAVTMTDDELVAVGNRVAGGDVADPTTALHSDEGLVVTRLDITSGNVVVETPASLFDDREFAITDAATDGETVAVVGHTHRPDRVAGVRLDLAAATAAGWEVDSSGIERPRLFWVDGRLVHVWENWAYGHLSVEVYIRSADGSDSVSRQLTSGDPWYCHAFASDGQVFVTEYSDPPRLGTVNQQTGTISWDRTLRSCDARPTPVGEVGFEDEDGTLYWYRQRGDGTSTRGEVVTDYESHRWRLDFASMADGAVLLASGRATDEDVAATHLLRVTDDGLQWHERFTDPNSHYAGRTVESLPGGRYAVAGTRGTDALDGWLLVADGSPADLPAPTTVRPQPAESTTTATPPRTPTPVETPPATPPSETTTTPSRTTSATQPGSPTATPAEPTGTAGASGPLFSTGAIAALGALVAGGVQYIRRSKDE